MAEATLTRSLCTWQWGHGIYDFVSPLTFRSTLSLISMSPKVEFLNYWHEPTLHCSGVCALGAVGCVPRAVRHALALSSGHGSGRSAERLCPTPTCLHWDFFFSFHSVSERRNSGQMADSAPTLVESYVCRWKHSSFGLLRWGLEGKHKF